MRDLTPKFHDADKLISTEAIEVSEDGICYSEGVRVTVGEKTIYAYH